MSIIEFKSDKYYINGDRIDMDSAYDLINNDLDRGINPIVRIYNNESITEIEYELLAVRDPSNTCSNCIFDSNNRGRLPSFSTHVSCLPGDCNGVNFILSSRRELTKIDELHLKSKLCTPDICVYHGLCDSAPLCLIKYILSD